MVRIVSASATRAVGTHDDVVIVHFRGRVVAEEIEALVETLRAHALTTSSGTVAFLDVVEAGTKPPEDRGRAAFARGMRELPLAAAAVVSLGEGFGPALVRSVVTGLVMLARPTFPVEVVKHVDAGCGFLARQVRSVNASALAIAHGDVRAALRPHP